MVMLSAFVEVDGQMTRPVKPNLCCFVSCPNVNINLSAATWATIASAMPRPTGKPAGTLGQTGSSSEIAKGLAGSAVRIPKSGL